MLKYLQVKSYFALTRDKVVRKKKREFDNRSDSGKKSAIRQKCISRAVVRQVSLHAKRRVTHSGINEASCRSQEEIGGDDSRTNKNTILGKKNVK